MVAGALGEEYSDTGGSYFNESIGGGSGQCVRAVGDRTKPDAIAVVGEFGLFKPKNGVAISTDGGVSFTTYDAGLFTDARYGAFPSAKTWYLSAGNWPEANDDKTPTKDDDPFSNDNNIPAADGAPQVYARTPRFELRRNAAGGYQPYARLSGRDAMVTSNDTVFQTQISMTQDGGATWTTVFKEVGDFYPNGIACQDDANCCFVAEADAGSEPGSRIYCTSDSGASWNRTFFNAGADNSLLDISVTGTAGEYWAVGGVLSELDASASFYHSTDNGATWTLDSSIKGSYASAVDCVDTAHCWSTTLQVLLQTASIASNTA